MQTNYKKRDGVVTTENCERFLKQNNLKSYGEGVNFLLEKLGEGDGQ